MLVDWEYLNGLERHFMVAKKDERELISRLLQKEYSKLMNCKKLPANCKIIEVESKINTMPMQATQTPLSEFSYIEDVIESCETANQLISAKRMVDNFAKKYSHMRNSSDKDFHVTTARNCLLSRIEKVRIQKEIKL